MKKIVHYCWFGPNPIPEKESKCIETWKTYLSDFAFVFWNESNFDIHSVPFVSQAYERGYYAFVSDYVRAWTLYEYGGLYLDTDVEIISPDFRGRLIENDCILGFETKSHIGTAIMSFAPKNEIIGLLKAYYDNHFFIDSKGRIDNIANVTILTDILVSNGLKLDGSTQFVNSIKIYARDYFYPKKLDNNEFRITSNTLAIHRCSNSWMSEKQKRRGNNWFWINILRPILNYLRKIGLFFFGKDNIRNVEIIIRNILK